MRLMSLIIAIQNKSEREADGSLADDSLYEWTAFVNDWRIAANRTAVRHRRRDGWVRLVSKVARLAAVRLVDAINRGEDGKSYGDRLFLRWFARELEVRGLTE